MRIREGRTATAPRPTPSSVGEGAPTGLRGPRPGPQLVSRTHVLAHGAGLWVLTATLAGAIGGTAGVPVIGTVVGAGLSFVVGLPLAALATVALAVLTRPGTPWARYAVGLQVVTAALVAFAVGLSVPVTDSLLRAGDLADIASETHVGPVTVVAAVIGLVLVDLHLLPKVVLPVDRPDRRWIAVLVVVGAVGVVALGGIGERALFGTEVRRHRATEGAVLSALDALGLESERDRMISTLAGTMNPMGCPTAAMVYVFERVESVPASLPRDLADDGWTVRPTGAALARRQVVAERGSVVLTVAVSEQGQMEVQAEAGCDR